jgi:hypothetical protein
MEQDPAVAVVDAQHGAHLRRRQPFDVSQQHRLALPGR